MTVKEIDNKLKGLHKKGTDLADGIESRKMEIEVMTAEYLDTLKHIEVLLSMEAEIVSHRKELANFEPQEVE